MRTADDPRLAAADNAFSGHADCFGTAKCVIVEKGLNNYTSGWMIGTCVRIGFDVVNNLTLIPNSMTKTRFIYKIFFIFVTMKASIGQQVKQALSGDKTGRVLTAAVISGSRHSGTIRVNNVATGQVLTLKRISIKGK